MKCCDLSCAYLADVSHYKVSHLDNYTEIEQLQGSIILQLKMKWSCEKHQGEHGNPGFCYIDLTDGHLGFNIWKLNIWASGIVR